jgi:hypothetical protein
MESSSTYTFGGTQMTTWAVVLTKKEDSTPRKVWTFDSGEQATKFEDELWKKLAKQVIIGDFTTAVIVVENK